MKRTLFILLTFFLSLVTMAQEQTVKLKVLETTDVHGSFLPFDFINQRPTDGSLARAYTYVSDCRQEYGDNLILVDCGDILQGQPIIYYYNYITPQEENVAASVLNYMGYDCHTYGNHDIETGHNVYDKWVAETKCPIMCANLVDNATGEPYVAPYIVFDRQGVRIAILGMVTTATPNWISEDKYSGLHFEDIATSAQKWVPYLRNEEHADIILGLFHSGKEGGILTDKYEENATLRVAREVDGFDAILYGHDHTENCEEITNNYGHTVWLLNPANAVKNIAELNIIATRDGDKTTNISLSGRIVDVRDMPIDSGFEENFAEATKQVKEFTSREIGYLTETMYTRDAFFGDSPYIDLVNTVQMELTGADLSVCAPLQANAVIRAGIIRGADMFNIYKYENLLSTTLLTGQEIKDYLEMSYSLWTNTMASPSDHIMLLKEEERDGHTEYYFVNPTFNFDSAYGIDYEVDVTRPVGEKVTIHQFSDGRMFDMDATYHVAMNSYRANNGGELLTKGAGIKKEDIPSRIVWTSDTDLRNYIMQYIIEKKTITPTVANNWQFVPTDWTVPALECDRELIFGNH